MVRDILHAAGGRKFVFSLNVFWFLCGLLMIGKLPATEFADIMQWLIGGYLASTAVQGSASIVSERIGHK